MEEYRADGVGIEATTPAGDIIGTHVLTPRGAVVGRIRDLHLDLDKLKVLGVTIKPGMFKKPVYIGAGFIDRLGIRGTKLSVTPTFLLVGKKVITSDGKILGKVVGVLRKDHTVDIRGLCIVRRFFLKRYLPYTTVKHEKRNILLNIDYGSAKKQLTKHPTT